MSESKLYPVDASVRERAWIDEAEYQRLYQESITDPEGFFERMAREHLDWFSDDWDRVSEVDMERGNVSWFRGGTLNACYNCLDRHLETRGDKTAIIW